MEIYTLTQVAVLLSEESTGMEVTLGLPDSLLYGLYMVGEIGDKYCCLM